MNVAIPLEQNEIDAAVVAATLSKCRSRRGVAIFDREIGAFRGRGHNGPPDGCPGREVCAGKCGKLSVHAESRALRAAQTYINLGHPPGPYDLIHVELEPRTLAIVACAGPLCWQCSREILDVGVIGGVWLYELCGEQQPTAWSNSEGRWRRYTAAEFHAATLRNTGILP